MPIDAVKIPQNVQVEDKVVGPLSLRQLIIMLVGGGFSYMIYALAQKSLGTVNIPLTILIWIPALLATAFAVVNINDLSLLRICFLLLEKTQKPSLRTWGPRSGISITIRTSAKKLEEDTKNMHATAPEQTAEQQIRELSRVVDRASPAIAEKNSLAPPSTPLGAGSPETEKKILHAVNRDAIQVDSPMNDPLSPALSPMSDLSIFRDVLPPNSQWPS